MQQALRAQHPRREYDLPTEMAEGSEYGGFARDNSRSQQKGTKRGREDQSDQTSAHESAYIAVTCPKCQKTGHDATDCWSDIVCAKCHRKGHPTNVCRATKDADGRPFKLPVVRFDDKVQQK